MALSRIFCLKTSECTLIRMLLFLEIFALVSADTTNTSPRSLALIAPFFDTNDILLGLAEHFLR